MREMSARRWRVPRVRTQRHVAAVLLLVALPCLALAGCGKANTANVTFDGLMLHPQVLTVPVGTTVTWTNQDPEPHTVTSSNAKVPDTSLYSSPQPGAFNSGPFEPGKSYSYTFRSPGIYKYADILDGYITGTVIVR